MIDRKEDNKETRQEEMNPTLQEAGTSVPDYGNVSGGSANTLQEEQGAGSDDEDNTHIASDEED